jgi:hypothetical protein
MAIKEKLSKIKEEQEKMQREVKEKTFGYILTALGLVAGLAWNDAIKSTIEYFFKLNSNSVLAKLIYAFIVTIIVALVSIYLIRISEFIGKKPEEGEQK